MNSAEPAFQGDRLEAQLIASKYVMAVVLVLIIFATGALTTLIAVVDAKRGGLMFLVGPFLVLVSFWGVWALARMRRRPTLRLDRVGLDHALQGTVRWEDVAGVLLVKQQGKNAHYQSLSLGLARASAVERSGLARFLLRRKDVLRIPVHGLDHSPEQIHAAVLALRDRVEPARIKGWFPGMNLQELESQRIQEYTLAELERLGSRAPTEREPERALAVLQDMEARLGELRPGVERAQQRRLLKLRLIPWVMVAVLVLWLVLRFGPMLTGRS